MKTTGTQGKKIVSRCESILGPFCSSYQYAQCVFCLDITSGTTGVLGSGFTTMYQCVPEQGEFCAADDSTSDPY